MTNIANHYAGYYDAERSRIRGVSGRQIESYVSRRFPGCVGQPSVHGAGRGSVQMFDGN